MTVSRPPRVRPLERTDAPAYRTPRVTALAESPAAFSASPGEEAGRTLAEIAERMAPATDNGTVTLGAFDGEDWCGFTAIVRLGKRKLRHGVELAGLYVAPTRRHRGIGRAVLHAVVDRARAMDGVRQIKLGVTTDNRAAFATYRALGFDRYALEPDALAIDRELHALE